MRLISFIRNILIIFLISTNQSYSNPLDKLFDKKWSLGGLPCNFKGGAYSRYSPEIAGGSDFFSNGKFNNSDQLQWFRYFALDKNTIKYERRIYADNNRLMVQMLGSPTALVSKTITKITFINDTKIKLETTVHRLDLKLSNTKKLSKLIAKKSESTSTLCDKKE
ncbi:hypothetical protein N9O66_01585 [Alphaproteobacteria bacterium]|nr:hypothetical protein [Alphaproteobacteria bacterium]MDA9915022.1 hypothetical protein [Alphaproteobacteria bacterium]MDB2583559.1 hypothetical protein [Alphaproteobacteria bacterium]